MRPISTILIAVLAFPVLCRAQALADHVPDDAVIYVGWKGVDDFGPGYAGSHFKAIMEASSLTEFFNESVPKLVEMLAAHDAASADNLKRALEVITPMIHHPTALYFGGFDPATSMPKVALLCDAGTDANKLQDFLTQNLAGSPIQCKTVGTLVVVATFDFTEPAGNSLSKNPAFQAALAKLVRDPVLAGYVDGAKLNATVDQITQTAGNPDVSRVWGQVQDKLGLKNLTSASCTAGFDGKDWAMQSLIAGIQSSDQPLDANLLKQIPDTATQASAANFDIAALVNTILAVVQQVNPDAGGQIQQGLDQIKNMLGINLQTDFLGSMGPQWAIYLDPRAAGSGPLGLVLLNRPRNADLLDRTISSIESFLVGVIKTQTSPEITVGFRTFTQNGLQIHYLAVPFVSPAWTFHNGTWFMGLYPQTVVSAAGRTSSKSILDNAEVEAIRKRLGAPQNITGFTYNNLPQTMPEGYQTWLAVSRLYLGLGDLVGGETPAMVLPPLEKILAESAPAGAMEWSDAEGIHMKSIEPFPGAMLLGGGGSSIGMTEGPLMASILLPALQRARETANRTYDMSNMRAIGQLVQIYMAENKGAYPPDLAATMNLAHANASLYICSESGTKAPVGLTPDQMNDWVNNQSDFIYIGAGLKRDSDPSLVVLYERGDYHKGDGMNLLYADGHVEFKTMANAHDDIERSLNAKKAANP